MNCPFAHTSILRIILLTLDMIIPAMLIRILGPFSRRYLKSTPFQKDTKYRLICVKGQ